MAFHPTFADRVKNPFALRFSFVLFFFFFVFDVAIYSIQIANPLYRNNASSSALTEQLRVTRAYKFANHYRIIKLILPGSFTFFFPHSLCISSFPSLHVNT